MSGNGWEKARAQVKKMRREEHTDEDIREMMLADDWEEDELEAVRQHVGAWAGSHALSTWRTGLVRRFRDGR